MRAISAASSSLKLNQAIIQIDRFERLDEHGLARGARSVNDARHGAPVGGAHGNHEAVVAQRDVIFAGRLAAGAQDAFERTLNSFARLAHCRCGCASVAEKRRR